MPSGGPDSDRPSRFELLYRKRSRGEAGSRVWLWPATAAIASFVVAIGLLRLRPDRQTTAAQLAWPGDADAAATMLQVVAGSVITATSLTFTLTVIALQLASQQYSPRLLREFARDRITQLVLAVLVSAFVMAVTVLRGLDREMVLPSYAVLAAFVLGLASVAALLTFIGHIARALRVDAMMLTVASETRRAMSAFYPAYEEQLPHDADIPPGCRVRMITSERSGFVQSVDVNVLIEVAERDGAFVEVVVRPGDHVVLGSPLARISSPATGDGSDAGDRLEAAVHRAIDLGYERTLEQDASYGFRQLTDIAVKALSPSINDPVTAAHSIGHMSDLVVRLTARRLGATAHAGEDGVPRVVVPDRDLRYYLDLACGQVRRYGAHEPTALGALLRLLRDAAAAARDDEQRAEVARQVALVLEEMAPDVIDDDARYVRELAHRVDLARCGDIDGAYGDRSGETRSI